MGCAPEPHFPFERVPRIRGAPIRTRPVAGGSAIEGVGRESELALAAALPRWRRLSSAPPNVAVATMTGAGGTEECQNCMRRFHAEAPCGALDGRGIRPSQPRSRVGGGESSANFFIGPPFLI